MAHDDRNFLKNTTYDSHDGRVNGVGDSNYFLPVIVVHAQ